MNIDFLNDYTRVDGRNSMTAFRGVERRVHD